MADEQGLTLPQDQPRATPAGPLRVAPPPQAFGAVGAGQGLEALGKGAAEGGEAFYQYAKAFQDLNNKAAADTANSDYAVASREAYNKWSLANPGAKAMTPNAQGVTPFDEFGQQLSQLRTDIGTKHNLSDIGMSLYDQDSRRLQSLVIGDADTYARQQQHMFWVAGSKAHVETLQNTMAQRPTDLDFISGIHDQIAQEVVHQQVLGEIPDTPEAGALATLDAMSKGLTKIVTDQGVHDPASATDLEREYAKRGWISPGDQDAIDRTLHGPLVAQGNAQAASGAFNAAVGGGNADQTLHAIMQAESGGQNIVNYREARGEKGYTASGYFQITNPTWARYAPPDIAQKYPRAIDAPFDVQQAVARTIFQHEGTAPWAESQATWSQHLGSTSPSAPPSAQAGSPIQRIETQLPQIQADSQARAAAWADKYGINRDEMQASQIAYTQAQYGKYKYTYEQDQTATAGTILSTIDKGDANGEPISDMHTLLSMPGMQDAYAKLTPVDQRSIEQHVYQNANMWTPIRSGNAQNLLGQAFSENPAQQLQFLQTNLNDPALDLQRSARIGLMKRQTDLREMMQKGGMTQTTQLLHTALSVPSIRLALPTDANAQNQYVGALTTELEGWTAANPGKQPSLNDYNAMAQKLTTQTGGFLGLGSHPAYQDIAAQRLTVPENIRAQIRLYAVEHGLPQPNETQIEATYKGMSR